MSFLFPKPSTPAPPPKTPNPNEALANADRESALLRSRRGRSGTILSDETKSLGGSARPFKSLMGE